MEQRRQEFNREVYRSQLEQQERELQKYSKKKERLKQKRVKALFDAECRRQEVRLAMEQMAVWNAFDNNIITEFLEYEKKCKRSKQPMMTVEAFVRKKAVSVHKKEE